MTTYRVLLPHPLESRLLMMQRDGEWRLPEWEDPTPHAWQATEHVNRAVHARFGAETTVLRCLLDEPATSGRQALRVYELDNHSPPHDVVPASTWIGRGELDMLRISDMDARAVLLDWFMRDAGEIGARGAAWTRRGWYVEALAWSVGVLREHGVAPAAPPEQSRAWEREFVMRFTGETGNFHFRAASGALLHEPALTRWLAGEFPGSVPPVLATDKERGWLLQEDVAAGTLPLEEVREEEEWFLAARRFGEIQAATAARVGDLHTLDVPYRGLEVLARRIPRLCADLRVLAGSYPGALSREEADRIASLTPTLLTLCGELATFDIPDALEHGDLRAGNIHSTLDGPLFVEWPDSSISHPFFSLDCLSDEVVGLLPAVSRESRRRLRDSYLAAWADVAPEEHLVRAFELARLLAPVHRAAAIHAEVLPFAGYDWEVAPAITAAMRDLLRRLSDED